MDWNWSSLYIYNINISILIINDTYNELASESKGIYKEKGSKFIAYAFPVHSKEDVIEKIQKIKKQEYVARHHCYAYILHTNKSEQRANDDGEPSSSAGKPILGRINSNNLTNTLVIVARYFGGVKLGIPGLINAYKTATSKAIFATKIISKTINKEYEITFNYQQINSVMRIMKKYNLEIKDTNFKIECKLIFAVRESKSLEIKDILKRKYELGIKNIKNLS